GATGPQGTVGQTGATGPAGPQSTTGSTGAQSATGAMGLPGPPGPAGAVGPRGPPGAGVVSAGSQMRQGDGAARSSDAFAQVANVALEPGSCVLIARVDLVNLLGFDLDSSQALCELRQVANPVPPLERGTLTSLLDEDVSRVFTMALTLTESSQ